MRALQISIVLAALASLAIASPVSQDQSKKLPLVDSKKLQRSVETKALLRHAQALQDAAYKYPERNRLMGGSAHNDTVDYLVKQLSKYDNYYDIEKQPWSRIVQVNGTGSLFVDGVDYNSSVFEYSPSGNVTTPLVVVNNLGCEASDYPATLAGNIALISRGTCQFGLKSALAGAAGAVGAIIYNNVEGAIASGTLGAPPRPEGNYVPTVGATLAQGQQLVATIGSGTTVTANVYALTFLETRTTFNVLATTKYGAKNTTLMLGAHTDSVDAGPGINDDGSGTVALLEIAAQLADYRTNNAVRFGWWSGEEEGLLGSTYYVEHLSAAELANVRAYLNFDMIASPNYVYAIYDGDGDAFNQTGPAGSAEIEHFFQAFFRSNGQPTVPTAFDGRSDYQAFTDSGIPAGGTFTGAEELKTAEEAVLFGGQAGVALDANYHGPGDTVANLNITAFEINARAIAAAVAEYGVSFASLPPKESVVAAQRSKRARRTVATNGAGVDKYRAWKLKLTAI